MAPSPSDYNNEDDFISACIAQRQDEHPEEDTDQSAAICFSMWSDKAMKGGKKREADDTPYGDVEYADPGFQSDGKKRYPIDTEEHIRAAWNYIQHPDNRTAYTSEQLTHIENKIIAAWKKHIDPEGPPSAKSNKGVVHKTHAGDVGAGMEFVLSDATVDRYGDVIEAAGWDLVNFSKNPIALFNHNPDFPIGRWQNLRIDKQSNALKGHLRMAPEGTSARIDEIRKLIDAGILRAVSVGFRPLESKPRDGAEYGRTYVRSELVESSLVAVPANPNAISVAKSLKISDDTLKMVFAKHGKEDLVTRAAANGEYARTSLSGKNQNMSSLSKRIEDAQTRIVSMKDQLKLHLEKTNDENPDDAQTAITEELTNRIATQEKNLETLKRAEAQLADQTVRGDTTTTGLAVVKEKQDQGSEQSMSLQFGGRPFATAAKKIKAEDYLWKAVALKFKHFCVRDSMSIDTLLKQEVGQEGDTHRITSAVLDMVTRSNTSVATTTTTGWAKELAMTMYVDLLESLMPMSIYPRLRAMGQSYTFGRNATISIPSRDATPTVGGGFVLQGSPIPVKQGAFSAITLTLQKCASIVPMTREIAEHSTPALEGIIRQAILEDTAVAIDTILMGSAAGSATQPVGMVYGVTAITANSAGATSLAKFQADVQALVAALVTATNGNLRRPVWIMSPSDVVVASMLTTTTGDQPYREELSRGTLFNIPVISSTTGTSDKIYLLDAADFATATGDVPRFDVSDQAVLHMDTAPTALSGNATATPVAAAFPIRSLWQTDSIAIRMIIDLTWVFLRSNTTVQFISGQGWN